MSTQPMENSWRGNNFITKISILKLSKQSSKNSSNGKVQKYKVKNYTFRFDKFFCVCQLILTFFVFARYCSLFWLLSIWQFFFCTNTLVIFWLIVHTHLSTMLLFRWHFQSRLQYTWSVQKSLKMKLPRDLSGEYRTLTRSSSFQSMSGLKIWIFDIFCSSTLYFLRCEGAHIRTWFKHNIVARFGCRIA